MNELVAAILYSVTITVLMCVVTIASYVLSSREDQFVSVPTMTTMK
jgi:hypothetical protein